MSYIKIEYDISNNNNLDTKPSIKYDYPLIITYFNNFLPELGGINYSFVSVTPNISLKRNNKSNDINQYYASNFTIIKRIHAFKNVTENDLEMIIEHIPDTKNTDQKNLYMCFGFSIPSGTTNYSDGFETLFQHINVDNISAATLSQATLDNYKLQNQNIQLNSALEGLKTVDERLLPDAVYYLDSSANTFIVYNNLIPIKNVQYKTLTTLLNSKISTSKIFNSTDCQIVKDGIVVPIPFTYLHASLTPLQQGFITLREGMDTWTGNSSTLFGNKYVYCRPSEDTSNQDRIVTTSINAYANLTNRNEGLLLNDITMIFIIMIVFLVMALFSPLWFLESNKYLKYNLTFLWVFRIAAIVIIFGGGLLTIVVSRVSTNVPDWLLLVGVIMIICFVLFYMVVYSFQKNTIHTQLTEIIENTLEDVDKNNIKHFRNYIFGETI